MIKKTLLYFNINFLFISWVLFVYLVFFIGFQIYHPGSLNFFNNLRNWDSGHFLGIALSGYTENYQYAFFPLYPVLIKGVAYLLKDYLLSAVLISIVSTFLGIKLLMKLIALELFPTDYRKFILFFLIFPASYYLILPYSEGLFFFLLTGAFYFFKLAKVKKPKLNLFIAGLFVLFASVTRILGIVILLVFLMDLILNKKFRNKIWILSIAPIGIFLYCFFLFIKVGDPFYFITAEAHWQRALNLPVVSFWESLIYFFSHPLDNFNLTILFNILFAVFGIGMAARSIRFLPLLYSLYALILVFIPLLTGTLTSFPRFILPVFPIFLVLGMVKNKFLNFSYIILSLVLLIYFEINFINGYWVS